MFDPQDRQQFLNFAGLFEGSLALLAIGIGWFVSINPVEHLNFDLRAVGVGFAAMLPLLLFFVTVYRWPIGPFREMRHFLQRELAPSLNQLTWYDLILMGLLAGISEELLFRGLLEPWLGAFWSNLLFGLAHWVTPTYGLLTFLVGYFFSWLMTVPEPGHQHLLAPIVTHAVYDYLAFLWIIRVYHREQSDRSE